MRRRRLSDLEVIEVSLVDRPANKRKFILFKSELKEGSTSMPEKQETEFIEELVEEMEKAEASGEAEKLGEAEAEETQPEEAEFETQQEQQPEQETEKALSQKAQAAIKAALKALWPVRAEIPRSVLDILGRLVGYPGYGYPGYATYGYPAPMGKAEELPEEVKTALETLWKEREELSKRLEEAERIAKEERAKREERESIEKFAQEYKNLPISAEEGGKLLKRLRDLDGDLVEVLEGLFKKLDGVVKTGKIFEEQGSSVPEENATPWAQLEAKARELQKSGLSKEQAIAKVIEENPELYEQYRKEIFERR